MADYVTVARTRDLGKGDMLRVIVNHTPICIFSVNGEYYATQDTCTHAEASLAEGELDGHVVACPLHGAEFDIKTGAALCFPATKGLTTYPVKIQDGQVLVLVDD